MDYFFVDLCSLMKEQKQFLLFTILLWLLLLGGLTFLTSGSVLRRSFVFCFRVAAVNGLILIIQNVIEGFGFTPAL